MSSKPNPTIIGAFVTAAIVLLVGMVLFFGSFSLFSQTTRYILFFDQSVNGLGVGSAVKYRGVPVGRVESVFIQVEGQHAESNSIPVVIAIDRSRLSRDLGTSAEAFAPEMVSSMIEAGLVARLNIESIITGQLFVEFSFEPSHVGLFQPQRAEGYDMPEIPTLGSSLDAITSDLARVISNFADLDLGRIDEGLNDTLRSVSTMLDGIDSARLSESFSGAADQVSVLLASDEFSKTLESARTVLDEVKATVASFNIEDGPLADTLAQWTDAFSSTLDGVDSLVADGNQLFEPNSSARFEFENALRELSRASQSLRTLTDYLERNPNALITGRAEGDE